MKAEDSIAARARTAVRWCAGTFVVLYLLAGAWLALGVTGFRIDSAVDPDGPSNPLLKHASIAGSWLTNGPLGRWACVAAAIAIVSALLTPVLAKRRAHWQAFMTSGVTLAGTVLSAALALFPFLMPSRLDPNSSLTVWDASSSHATLLVMLVVTVLLLPLVILYTSWVYHVMRGRVTLAHIRQSHGMY
jgi:cytochrome d ubiquinol oxidase subunit II